MKTKFIPIDYDYFDLDGKNYIKIIGRDEKGGRICAIDSCDTYMGAILNDDVSTGQVNKLEIIGKYVTFWIEDELLGVNILDVKCPFGKHAKT